VRQPRQRFAGEGKHRLGVGDDQRRFARRADLVVTDQVGRDEATEPRQDAGAEGVEIVEGVDLADEVECRAQVLGRELSDREKSKVEKGTKRMKLRQLPYSHPRNP
jgi:hypothetical protein